MSAWNRLVVFYKTNALFHGLVNGVEFAVASFIVGWRGGLPTNRSGWIALGMALGGAVYGAIKQWLVIAVPMPPTPQPPAQG